MREIWTHKPLLGFWASQTTPSAKRVAASFSSLSSVHALQQGLLLTLGRVSRRKSLGITAIPVIKPQNHPDTEGGTSCPFPIAQEDLLETWGVEKGTGGTGVCSGDGVV